MLRTVVITEPLPRISIEIVVSTGPTICYLCRNCLMCDIDPFIWEKRIICHPCGKHIEMKACAYNFRNASEFLSKYEQKYKKNENDIELKPMRPVRTSRSIHESPQV